MASVSAVRRFSNPLARERRKKSRRLFCGFASYLSQSVPELPSPASSVHSFQRLLFLPSCRGLPQQRVGSLDECRHGGSLLVVVVLCCWQCQRGRLELQCRPREPAQHSEPGLRSLRALRPASTRGCFLPFAIAGSDSRNPPKTASCNPEWRGPRLPSVR